MNKFEEVKQELQSIRRLLIAANEKKHLLKQQLFNDKKITRKEFNTEWDKIEKMESDLNLKRELLTKNAEFLLVSEYTPIFLSIWNTYTGKKLGPKTREKIEKEFREQTGGVCIVFDYNCNNQVGAIRLIHYPLSAYIYLENAHFYTDSDNHILSVKKNNLIKPTNYIKDIPARISQLKEKAAKIEKQIKLLNTLYSEFREASCYAPIDHCFNFPHVAVALR